MDGPSSAEQSYLARPFVLGTRLILAYPRTTISIALLLAVLASGYSAARLGYRANRLDLVNPNSETTQFWNRYSAEFGSQDDAVIVVEGAGREQIIPVIDDLAAAVARDDRLLHSVLHRVDLAKLRSKGLYYLPAEQLQAIDHYLQQVAPIVSGDWSRLNIGRMTAGMLDLIHASVNQQALKRSPAKAIDPAESLSQLETFCDSLAAALQRKPFRSPWPSPGAELAGLNQLATQYMVSPDGRFGFVTLRLRPGADALNPVRDAARLLREIIADARTRHPEVRIGLTGLPIMEDDEMTTSQNSMLVASIISFIGVAMLFIAGFGGVRHALLANAILLVGMAWSFAFATATVGHLNILSVTFTATLIGIGIDYGVYYCARYLQLRKDLDTCEAALLETARTAGPAITIGAITTAISFFAAGCTTFVGVSELGIIAGGGILLCAVAELTLLPAAIYLVDRSDWGRSMPEPLAVHTWIQPLLIRPRLTLGAAGLFTLVLAGGMSKLWYDNNLLNMQAVGLESVELERRLLQQCHQSSWYALSLADGPEQLLARKAAFDKLPSVERTEEIVSLIPLDAAHKRPLIEQIGSRLANLPDHVPLIPVERHDRLVALLARLQQFVGMAGPQLPCAQQLGLIRSLLERLPPADSYALLSRFQQQAAEELLARLRQLRAVAGAQPPQLSDLPPTLVSRFVGQHGKHLLRIYGRGNIWDTQNLTRFVQDVRKVDPQVTGNPLQAHGASLEMRQSFQQAALYSLAIIIVVLWLDFRNWRHALLAALPLGVGVLETFGALGWLNIPLNPANMIALPLILGIGVDYGVHIVHEFRERQGPYRMSPGTAVAVLVDALTTIMGYGALMVASHQGLQSLGRVLTLAVTFCLFTSLIMLPALLTWVTRNRPVVEPQSLPLGRSDAEAGADLVQAA
jgi:hopanoid biosynthesis associated RND transporter like protein HpnN